MHIPARRATITIGTKIAAASFGLQEMLEHASELTRPAALALEGSLEDVLEGLPASDEPEEVPSAPEDAVEGSVNNGLMPALEL